MSITGGIKFFYKAMNLYKDGAVGTASTNSAAAKYVLSHDNYTQWESIGSNDTISEYIYVQLPATKTITRMFLTEMNFKDFEVHYWDGAAYQSFTNVIGENGNAYTGVKATTYAFESAYFEFDSVSTDRLRITATKTQVANQEKYLCKFLVSSEIGTMQGFPRIDNRSDRNEIKTKTIGGKFLISKSFNISQIKVNFKTHPYQADINLIETLYDSEDPFLVFPCGGRHGTQYFKIEQKTWKLGDVFNMKLSGDMDHKFEKGVYLLGVNKDVTFEEHI